MSPALTFLIGLALLVLLFWYCTTDIDSRKRLLGLALTILFTAFSVAQFWPADKKIALGIDIAGGSSFLIQLTPNAGQTMDRAMQESAVEVIRRRVDALGVSEPVISPVGTDRILVQLPGLDPEMVKDAQDRLQRVAKLEFRLVHQQSMMLAKKVANGEEFLIGYETKPYDEKKKAEKVAASPTPSPSPGAEKKPEEAKAEEDKEPDLLLVRDKPDIVGSDIARAFPQYGSGGYFVGISFTGEGKKKFGELTKAHVGELFAILLDDRVISAPVIRTAITDGECVIEGNFKAKEVEELASALQNPLQSAVKIIEQRSVSPTLGKESVMSGIYAGLLGLAFTFVFVLVYYRFPGLIANIALVVNMALLLGAMGMFHFVLTLPGIAGIILSIGMAVDANVLIYERLREELEAGKSLKYAVEAAYTKAFSSIFDANVTTLITAIILFWQSSGPVKGFAVTLTVGIIASMFAALVVTRNCFDWAIHLNWVKKITMLNLIKGENFDFLGKRKVAITISLSVIVLSMAFFGWRGKDNFGVDFTGGELVTFAAPADVTPKQIQDVLPKDMSPPQEEKTGSQRVITVRGTFGKGEEIASTVTAALGEKGVKTEQIEKVGPVVGKQLAMQSGVALILGLLGILIYVSARFEFSFAIGAIVALLHDVIITVGVFALFQRELSLIMVGAILTIAGYSINDTIVVYDRIREGLKAGQRGSVAQIMNRSINDTLSRTILTGGTTLASVLALFLFGGPVLNDFAFAMFIGIVVGTYSSIYIAAPVVLWWAKARGTSLRREVAESELSTPAPARS